jgi:hypothetical protein
VYNVDVHPLISEKMNELEIKTMVDAMLFEKRANPEMKVVFYPYENKEKGFVFPVVGLFNLDKSLVITTLSDTEDRLGLTK